MIHTIRNTSLFCYYVLRQGSESN